MCSSFTWGAVSVHYLLGLPLAYALRNATPNGLILMVKLSCTAPYFTTALLSITSSSPGHAKQHTFAAPCSSPLYVVGGPKLLLVARI